MDHGTYLFNAKITDTSRHHLAVQHRILHALPTIQSLPLPTVWTMQQIQINISQPALLQALLYRLSRLVVPVIRHELRRKPDVFPPQIHILRRLQKLLDWVPNLFLVTIPLCGVDTSIAVLESDLDGVFGFLAFRHIHAEVDAGHFDTIVELYCALQRILRGHGRGESAGQTLHFEMKSGWRDRLNKC